MGRCTGECGRSGAGCRDTGFVRGLELGETAADATFRRLPLRNDVVELPIPETLTHDHDQVEGLRPGAANGSKRLAHQALGPVSLGGIANAARGRDAQARSPPGRGPVQHEHEPARNDAPPTLLDAQKLRALPDPITGQIPTRGSGIGHGNYFLVPAVTARRQRPRRRRFLRTARPPRVSSRLRKPCVRSRLVLWG